jgi:hypothetical protein
MSDIAFSSFPFVTIEVILGKKTPDIAVLKLM